VVEFLREYLTVMTRGVHARGTDKYIGDAIMALYNVPFEARTTPPRRCAPRWISSAGLRACGALRAPLGAPPRCGSIHTGDAVGARWARAAAEYTAIGDTVNLGSRLESITKDFDVPIVISRATWVEVKDLFRRATSARSR